MGTQDAKREAQMARRNRRRLDAGPSRLENAFNGGSPTVADWGEVRPEWIQQIIVDMQRLGGAVTFGLSREGGAYMVTLLLQGDRKTQWIPGNADMETELEAIHARLESITEQ